MTKFVKDFIVMFVLTSSYSFAENKVVVIPMSADSPPAIVQRLKMPSIVHQPASKQSAYRKRNEVTLF